MKEKNIGFKITMARKMLGISQTDLAKKLSLSRQTLSYWENSTAIPRIKQLEKIATVLKKDISYFLDDEQNSFSKKIYEKSNLISAPVSFSLKESSNRHINEDREKVPAVAAIAHAGVVLFTDTSLLSDKATVQFTVKAAEDTPYFKNGDKLIFDTKATPKEGSLVLVLQDKIYKITSYKKYLAGKLVATAIFKSI